MSIHNYPKYIINENEILGKGSLGNIYLGQKIILKEDKKNLLQIKKDDEIEEVALKELPNEFENNNEVLDNIQNVINISLELKNTNIVKMIDIIDKENKKYLVYELCNGGDLRKYMNYFGRFDEELIQLIIIKMINALFELHRKKVIHHNIKPENILIQLFPEDKISILDEKIKKIKNILGKNNNSLNKNQNNNFNDQNFFDEQSNCTNPLNQSFFNFNLDFENNNFNNNIYNNFNYNNIPNNNFFFQNNNNNNNMFISNQPQNFINNNQNQNNLNNYNNSFNFNNNINIRNNNIINNFMNFNNSLNYMNNNTNNNILNNINFNTNNNHICVNGGLGNQIIFNNQERPKEIMDDVLKSAQFKLSGFGISKFKNNINTKNINGTPLYMAPEILCPNTSIRTIENPEVDIWALGVLAFEMFFGKRPFEANSIEQLLDMYKKGEYNIMLEDNQEISKEFLEFLNLCLQKNSKERATIYELRDCNFYNNDISFMEKFDKNNLLDILSESNNNKDKIVLRIDKKYFKV